MKKMNTRKLKKFSPTVLSCAGAVGVVGTSVLAVKATPKALRKIRADSRNAHNDPDAYTKLEAFQSAWIYYIPSVVMGAATMICIFGANILNKHQQAAITSAYALLNDAYQDYKDKLKELYGEDAHRKIMEAIAVEKALLILMSIIQKITGCFMIRSQNDILRVLSTESFRLSTI